MFVKKKYEAKDEPVGFVEFINAVYNAYCEPTPDGLLLEVSLIGPDGADAATAAANVAPPLTEEKITNALRYAALKGMHQYIGDNLVSPAKDGGISTKKVADNLELFAHRLSYTSHFGSAAANIVDRLQKDLDDRLRDRFLKG